MMRAEAFMKRLQLAGSQWKQAIGDFFEPEGLSALPGVVLEGLRVLYAEVRWLTGPDVAYRRDIGRLQQQQVFYESEIARMATLVDPRREQLAMDLALLREDLAQKQARRAAARKDR